MAKIHLKMNKGANGQRPIAACAGRADSCGKVYLNNRRTYSYMASEIVDFAGFKATAPEQRCFHCVDAGLQIRNRQRRAHGKPPVESLFEE
jgi:hypothetical protein